MNIRNISIVGLGYVGLPVAVQFGKVGRVVGFDIDSKRIADLRKGIDYTNEVDLEVLRKAQIEFTNDPQDLKKADFHIVCVPTPITLSKQPDLDPILSASRIIGQQLKKGDIVVYESTVYPGLTEEECVPILEEVSGLKFGKHFTVGYSPERINPGDKEHRFENTTKIISGSDAKTLEIISKVYSRVIKSPLYKASSIKVAEAAKIIENTQRDINIALMNELALICHRLNIDTHEVLDAAATKWNFSRFSPGLVGGHCIGVDPYYLTYKAQMLGYHPQVILSGRRINDSMGHEIAHEIIKNILRKNKKVADLKVTILGMTFKENVPDIRNSRVIDIVETLKSYGVQIQVHDPMISSQQMQDEFNMPNTPLSKMEKADAVILAVAHQSYQEKGWGMIKKLLKSKKGFVADLKACLDKSKTPKEIHSWRL